jgi:hypothetical protein
MVEVGYDQIPHRVLHLALAIMFLILFFLIKELIIIIVRSKEGCIAGSYDLE